MTNGLVSVIISDLFERRLPETVENLKATADGPIEIIVKEDGDGAGMRRCLNEAAQEAQGEYLFKIDGHCIMSPHWDTLMKQTCANPNDMVVARIRGINDSTWSLNGVSFSFVTVNPDLTIIKSGDFDDIGSRVAKIYEATTPGGLPLDVAETMASIGCAWLIPRTRFFELGQNWEQLGRWGNLGVEWALKVWLSGGRTLVHRDVTCGHLFRRQSLAGNEGYQQEARQYLGETFVQMKGPQQFRPLNWLSEHFDKETDNGGS